jgi:pentose-5-phosphate-3-epimerase
VLDKIDLILIMSVNPGFGGQKFIPEALRVAAVRRRIDESGRDIRLEIDGGVKGTTSPRSPRLAPTPSSPDRPSLARRITARP